MMLRREHQDRQGQEAQREGDGDCTDQFLSVCFASGCHRWHFMVNLLIIKLEAIFIPKMLARNSFRACRRSKL